MLSNTYLASNKAYNDASYQLVIMGNILTMNDHGTSVQEHLLGKEMAKPQKLYISGPMMVKSKHV